MARHIYVHIPFCEAKCAYCSFYSVPGSSLKGDYIESVKREVLADTME